MNEKKYGRLDAVIDSGTNPNAIKEELMDELDEELDEDLEEDEKVIDQFGDETLSADALEGQLALNSSTQLGEEEEDISLDEIDNILELKDDKYPKFTLAKNKARFLRMVSWYRAKEEWIEVAPLSGVTKLFKQQTKELEGIRSSKLDYEMELETGTLTPSQRSYRRDELKMCRVQEKMAVHLISKLQVKIKSGRR
ncbi:MAG: hypothetical protein ACXWRA_12840 [Pseudobdellovibrionaceae bacterium]